MDIFKLLNRTLNDQMGVSQGSKGPDNLRKLLYKTAIYLDIDSPEDSISKIMDEIVSENPDGDIRNLLGHFLADFDSIVDPTWSSTKENTYERRNEVLKKFSLSKSVIDKINKHSPFYDKSARPIVITDDYDHWYPGDNVKPRFYWDNYAKSLALSGWPQTSVLNLDIATDDIMTRLDNPLRKDDKRKAARGLVVGYVQSGKTANFTGVVAKSIDAGYKMIIILAGTLNVLRAQTQRRLDKELVGKNNLMHSLQSYSCPPDYEEDPGWDEFVEYAQEPRARIERLTDSKTDFTSDFAQKLVPMLAYEDRELRDAENLKKMPVKIMVVKKNTAILKRLIRDLSNVQLQVKDLPVIIIDDESDQASVNTAKITKLDSDKRTKVNSAIVNLLKVFSAPQYIGYTATPAANVLVNPGDENDIFPRDFILTLPRPIGYMGVRDFYDFDENWNDILEAEPGNILNSDAYVRKVKGDDEEDENLQKAILSFIISGALKLYRYSNNIKVSIKHHTMLYHSTVKQKDHDEARHLILEKYIGLLNNKIDFFNKLKNLFETDFIHVSLHRAEVKDAHWVPDFKSLKPFIEKAVLRINQEPVRVVNGDKSHEDQIPNFEKQEVWSILVGGAKLSRGYTVEGLTISYYRRRAAAGDTLMQAGRWFGFRKNYQDLVRLFIGVKEKSGQKVRNLYTDFGGICRDEELFREELRQYTKLENDEPIRPRDLLPPLPVHGLDPTSKNKMRLARFHLKNLGSKFLHKAANISNKKSDRLANITSFKKLLECSNKTESSIAHIGNKEKKVNFDSYQLNTTAIVSFLKSYKWEVPNQIAEEICFIESKKIDTNIEDWLVVLPKTSNHKYFWELDDSVNAGVYSRKTDEATGKFKAITDPEHVKISEYLLGHSSSGLKMTVGCIPVKTNRAILLVYPVIPNNEIELVNGDIENYIRIGFGIYFPENNSPIENYIIVDQKLA